MYYKGSSIEVIVNVLPDVPLSLDGLMLYHRSSHLQIVSNDRRSTGPYVSLKGVAPQPLFDFPGHPAIREDWFKELLLFDAGDRELVLTADLLRHASKADLPEEVARYYGGEFLVKPGTKLIAAEPGLVWSENPDDIFSQLTVAWAFVKSIQAKLKT